MRNINCEGAVWSWIAGIIGLPVLIALVGRSVPASSGRIAAGVAFAVAIALLYRQKKYWPADKKAGIETIFVGLGLSVLCWLGVAVLFIAAFAFGTSE